MRRGGQRGNTSFYGSMRPSAWAFRGPTRAYVRTHPSVASQWPANGQPIRQAQQGSNASRRPRPQGTKVQLSYFHPFLFRVYKKAAITEPGRQAGRRQPRRSTSTSHVPPTSSLPASLPAKAVYAVPHDPPYPALETNNARVQRSQLVSQRERKGLQLHLDTIETQELTRRLWLAYLVGGTASCGAPHAPRSAKGSLLSLLCCGGGHSAQSLF